MAEYRMSMPGAHAHRQGIAFAVASADRDALVQARQDHPARERNVPVRPSLRRHVLHAAVPVAAAPVATRKLATIAIHTSAGSADAVPQ